MDKKASLILAIESSCDDTSAAVLRGEKVLSNIIANQEVHRKFGGVIPELASRSHQKNILPVIDVAIKEAGIDKGELQAIAYTKGPGLPGSLIVGSAFTKSLSMALDLPIIEVNHMQAHILAHFIEGVHEHVPEFPFLCLTVSGGHTQLVLVKDHFDMEIVGTTLDDAAGEAFDKVAKLLGLEYPGGPLVDKYASRGNASKFDFPKPRIDGLNFSFSGLKTSVLYFLKRELEADAKFIEKNLNDICASVQQTIVDILMEKLINAAAAYKVRQVALAGGVSANSGLRRALEEAGKDLNWETYIPPLQYCTDNAAMIGISAYFKYQRGEVSDLRSLPSARLKF